MAVEDRPEAVVVLGDAFVERWVREIGNCVKYLYAHLYNFSFSVILKRMSVITRSTQKKLQVSPRVLKTLLVELVTENGPFVCIVSERWLKPGKKTVLLYPTHHTPVKTEKAVSEHEEPTEKYEEFHYVTRRYVVNNLYFC